MGNIKQINFKNRTYYFFKDIINIEEFNSSLLKIDKKSYKDIDIYYIGYITIKKIGDYDNIYSVNPFHLITGKVDGYIMQENNGNNYLVFDSTKLHSAELRSTDEKKKVLKKHRELCDGIKNEIETINGCKKGEYGKDFMKIRFNKDDSLSLKKPLKLHLLIIIVKCIFEEFDKFYPHFYLDDCLYELRV